LRKLVDKEKHSGSVAIKTCLIDVATISGFQAYLPAQIIIKIA